MCRIVLVCQDLDLWKLAASDQCTETLRSPRMGDFIDAKAPNADRLFGYKLTGQYFPFIVCASGIFGCYCLSSIAQEYIYYRGFQSSTLLTLSAKAFAALWGIGAGGLRNRKAPQIAHVGVGILTFATMFLSNRALVTLNYPTQTLFKSAKLIPVMLGAIAINGKRFHILEYLGALGLLLGLLAFTLTDMKVRPNFDPIGVWWITSALVADALIGNLQEKLFHQYGSSANEMMACSNVWAALLSLLSCAIDGSDSLWAAYDQLVQDHWIAASIIAYSALNVLGIYFIIVMITMFGATITTFTTSLRKALSVVLSFVVYAKPFAWGYLVGGLVTAAGIAATMRASALKRQSASSAPSSDSSSTSGQTESVELRPLMQQLDRQFSSGSTASASSPALPTSPMNRIGDATDSLQRILVPDANMSAPASPEQPRSGWALARKSPSMSQFQVNERLP